MEEKPIPGIKRVREFFVKRLKNPLSNEFAVTGFFVELEKYRAALEEACVRILGKDRGRRLLELDKQLLDRDAYLFEIADISNCHRFGFSPERHLIFYVATDLKEVEGIKIDSNGVIEGGSIRLKTSPFFFLNPEIMKKHAKELEGTSLPVYFTSWVHEYCHFIGYCMQERPIAVAILILFNYLTIKIQKNDLTNRDLTKLLESEKDKGVIEIIKTIIYLQGLDEDMANYLEELIREEMRFDLSDYPKRINGTFFYHYFKKWGKKRFVEYIQSWNEANFVAPEFMKAFLKTWINVKIERYPKGFLDKKA